jgi:hypothetical protein
MNAGSIFCTGPKCFLQASFLIMLWRRNPKKSERDFEWQLTKSKCNGFAGQEDKEAGEVVESPC